MQTSMDGWMDGWMNWREDAGADPGFRGGGFVQEFRLENRSYPDVHDFSLRMQVIIANANNIADSRREGAEHPPPQKKTVSAPGMGG